MEAVLEEFAKADPGFRQFVLRYEDISSNEAVRQQYAIWTSEVDAIEQAEAIGFEKGEVSGFEKGESKKAIKDARYFLGLGISPEDVAKGVELPLEDVLELMPSK